jgi:hypothetical protein
MPTACVLLLLASTSAGAFAGGIANDDCAGIRSGNTRLLNIADVGSDVGYLGMYSGLITAGWRLGVLSRKCDIQSSSGCGECCPSQ